MQQSNRIRQELARYYRMSSVQVSLGVVLAFLISTIFIAFAIRPTFATIASLRKEIEESKKTLTILETKVSALNKASGLMQSIQGDLPKLNVSVPDEGIEYNTLTVALELAALDTNVKLESFTIGESILQSRLVPAYTPSKNQEIKQSQVTIRVRGEYENIFNFVAKLGNALEMITIDGMVMSKEVASSRDESGGGSLTLAITGKVDFLIDPTSYEKTFMVKGGR